MEQSTLAILIIVLAVISFALEKIPLAVTAMIAALAMGIFGIIDLSQIYGDFGSSAAVFTAAMMIVGNSLFENGVTDKIGEKLLQTSAVKNEKVFIVVIVMLSAFLSAFASNSAVVAMFIPLIGAVVAKSNGKIENKNCVMAVGMAAGAGGFATLAGSTPQMIGQGIFEATPGMRGMTFFELTKAGLPLVLIMVVYFGTVGYKLMKKTLEFEDVSVLPESAATEEAIQVAKWKTWTSALVAILCVVAFGAGLWNITTVALIGATILIGTNCISLKSAFRGVDWNTIVILGASQAFARGLETSGAGRMIAEQTVSLFGANATPMVILSVLIVTTVVLTNFMSNAAVASMLIPIAINMAFTLQVNPMTYGIAVVIASQIAFATPVGTPCVTQTLVGGYRYKDYVKIGAPVTILMTIASIFLIPLMYGL